MNARITGTVEEVDNLVKGLMKEIQSRFTHNAAAASHAVPHVRECAPAIDLQTFQAPRPTLLKNFLVDKRKSSGSKVAGTFAHGSLN